MPRRPRDPEPLVFRRELRRTLTDAERMLWSALRAHRFADAKFRRQHAVGPYVVDFYCASPKLAIELDGGQHFDPEAIERDRRRTEYLEARGVRVLRFTNLEMFGDRDGVLASIWAAVRREPPSP